MATKIEVLVVLEDGTEHVHVGYGDGAYVAIPVLMRGGFGQRRCYLTGERDPQGRPIYREGRLQ